MEFESEEPVSDDTVTLDFNLAFSPFCVFSDTISCLLSPRGMAGNDGTRWGESPRTLLFAFTPLVWLLYHVFAYLRAWENIPQ